MKNRMTVACVLAVAGFAAGAVAQDSTPRTGVASDAVSPYNTSEQRNDYVADLTPVTTGWGNTFGLAAYMKNSRAVVTFNTALSSSQAISAMSITGPFAGSAYALWFGPQFGVNNDPAVNLGPATLLLGKAEGRQLVTAGSEFDGGYNGVVGAYINYFPSDPTRLYVSRVQAYTNGSSTAQNQAQLGLGSVDASGNVYSRADDTGNSGIEVIDNNIIRANIGARNTSALNIVSGIGGGSLSDTGDFIVRGDTVRDWLCPSNLPAEVTGGNGPLFYGSTFNDLLGRECSPLPCVNADSAHMVNGEGGHVGGVSYSRHAVFGGTFGTGAMLTRNDLGERRVMTIWGLDADANPAGGLRYDLPTSITDNDTLVDVGALNPLGDDEFGHIFSQTPFRGGPPVATGLDAQGRVLVAAQVTQSNGGADWPFGYIAVARRTPPGGLVEWTTAAYCVVDINNGTIVRKNIKDGPGGATVGELTVLGDVTGGAPQGPSMSAPAFDSAGNIWFVSSYRQDNGAGGFINRNGLFRAVYDADTFSYELELVHHTGKVVTGANSGRAFLTTFMAIADSNSVASNGFWSNNVNQMPWDNNGAAPVGNEDPANLGGLTFAIGAIYDIDGDGAFNTPPNGVDQSYNTHIFIAGADFTIGFTDCNENGRRDGDDIALGDSLDDNGNGIPDECEKVVCYPDCDGNDVVNAADVGCFLSAYFQCLANQPPADPYVDCDGNGVCNAADVGCFLSLYFQALGPCQ